MEIKLNLSPEAYNFIRDRARQGRGGLALSEAVESLIDRYKTVLTLGAAAFWASGGTLAGFEYLMSDETFPLPVRLAKLISDAHDCDGQISYAYDTILPYIDDEYVKFKTGLTRRKPNNVSL